MNEELKARMRHYIDLYQTAARDICVADVEENETEEHEARKRGREAIFLLREEGKVGVKALLGLALSEDLLIRTYVLRELIDFDLYLAKHLIDDSKVEYRIYSCTKIYEEQVYGNYPENIAFCRICAAGDGIHFGNRRRDNGVYMWACRGRNVEQKLAYTHTEWDYAIDRESELGQKMLRFRSCSYILLLVTDVDKQHEYAKYMDKDKTPDPLDLLEDAYWDVVSLEHGVEALKAMAESDDLCLASYAAYMFTRTNQEDISFSVDRLKAIAKMESLFDPIIERFDLAASQKAKEFLLTLGIEPEPEPEPEKVLIESTSLKAT